MSAPMTDPELQALAEAATPGPWEANVLGSEGYAVLGDTGRRMRGRVAVCGYENWDTDKANAEFIAAANPTVILALLVRLARADAIEQAARAAIPGFDPECPCPQCVAVGPLRAALEAS